MTFKGRRLLVSELERRLQAPVLIWFAILSKHCTGKTNECCGNTCHDSRFQGRFLKSRFPG